MQLVLQNNASLAIPPSSYMEPSKHTHWHEYTNQLYLDDPNEAVLGINTMLNHDILFDWEWGVMGFPPVDCQ